MKTNAEAESDEGRAGLETELDATVAEVDVPTSPLTPELQPLVPAVLVSSPDALGSSSVEPPVVKESAQSPAAPTAAPVDSAAAIQSNSASTPKTTTLQSVIDLLHDLAIAVVVCVLLITYVVQAFKVQGTSMSPELRDGERILVNKFEYRIDAIERGDVVVFWYPEDPDLSFIKRVIGLPGESVEIRAGDVYVDGTKLDEPYVLADHADERGVPAQEIRPGHFFVLGDNRRGSNDSRSWGLVPKRYIYGKAFVRIWPPSELGFVD